MAETPFLRNADALAWDTYARGRFGCAEKFLTGGMTARNLDCTLIRLEPGQVSWPHHFHHVSEELFVILEGTGTLRYEDGSHPLRPGDVVTCPPGPGSAHQLIADQGEALSFYAISTEVPMDIIEYPDSGKLYACRGQAGGGAAMFKLADQVDYWADELS